MYGTYFTDHGSVKRPTALFNMPPVGAGTGQVQSLQDYMQFLALLHRIAHGALLELAFRLVGRADTHQARRFGGALCHGITEIARMLVDALSQATGRQDIASTTMLACGTHVSRVGLMRARPKYCPRCFDETPPSEVPHIRLLWCLDAVQCCPVHAVQLVAPSCGVRAGHRSQRWVLAGGICAGCGSVGMRCSRIAAKACSARDLWTAQQAEALIAQQQSIEALGSGPSKEFLRRYCQQPGNSVMSVAGRTGLGTDTLNDYIKVPSRTMALSAFLKIAAAERMSLVGLMRGELVPSDPPAPDLGLPSYAQRRWIDWGSIGARSEQALGDGHSPASWARELGVDPTALARQLPAACAKLAAQVEQRKADERHKALAALVRECEDLAGNRLAAIGRITPIGRQRGARFSLKKSQVLAAFDAIFNGEPLPSGFSPEAETLIREAAQRLIEEHNVPVPRRSRWETAK